MMAYNYLSLALHTILLIFISTAAPTSSSSSSAQPPSTTPQPTPAPAPPLPLNLQHHQQQQQFNSIIDALIGTGDFGTWANILSAADPSALPPFSTKTTLFIPSDDALSHLPTTPPISFDPFIFPYHIVPNHRLSFSDLVLHLRLRDRLPTLLPDRSILVTNNSLSNFTLDDSRVTRPDLYATDAVIVHGIEGILDYAVYGDGVVSFSLPEDSPPPEAVTSSRPPSALLPPPPTTAIMGQGRSGVSCCLLLCTHSHFVATTFISAVVCAVLLLL